MGMTDRPTYYVTVRAAEDGGLMTWPHPDDPEELGWRLRYGDPSRAELLAAASHVAAYRHLLEMPQRLRNQRVREIRAAAGGPQTAPKVLAGTSTLGHPESPRGTRPRCQECGRFAKPSELLPVWGPVQSSGVDREACADCVARRSR